MARRSKAGSAKSRRRKPAAPKRASGVKAVRPVRSSADIQESEIARLAHDLNDALERETAASEILNIISSAHAASVQPVLDTVVSNAARLCRAVNATIYLREDDSAVIHAQHGPPGLSPIGTRRAINRDWVTGAAVLDAQTIQVADLLNSNDYPAGRELARRLGHRTTLAVPLLRDKTAIGVILATRREVHPFSKTQIALLQSFAAQAVIAIENARLLNELRESLQQQTATADVLKVISRSTFDLQTVLNTLTESAARLCEADIAAIHRQQGSNYQTMATYGETPDVRELVLRTVPFEAGRGSVLGRTVAACRPIQIPDVLADPDYSLQDVQHKVGFRTILGVPILREGNPIGVIVLMRLSVRPFTEKQIELATTFADQAGIAIENARLLNELRQRTADLSESLEQQTATSEVLKVISSSPGELEPVFRAILESAARLCDANFGNIFRWDGEVLHLVAAYNTPPAFDEARRRSPLARGQNNPIDKMLATKSVLHIADLAADERYIRRADSNIIAAVELGGVRTFVGVPMLKDNELIGALIIYRQEVRPFSDKQIELVQNFAAQAVIAIENARLLNELRQRTADLSESLEQQTATSEVLKVISSSPGELEPVFRAMLESATRLCEAKFATLLLREGGAFRAVALHNAPPAYIQERQRDPLVPITATNALNRLVATKQIVQIADLRTDQSYLDRSPGTVVLVEAAGARSFLAVPMLKEDELIGAIVIYRQEVKPFADKLIALVQNFAAQAVIAIENARLLNELRESLDRQTATSEILSVISSSPGELEPVFQTMLDNATRICEAKFGSLYLYSEDGLTLTATHNAPPAFAEARRRGPIRPAPDMALGQVIRTKQMAQVPDLMATRAYAEGHPTAVDAVKLASMRTVVAVPMLKDNRLIGIIASYRQEVRPFTEKQIALLQSFAAQAVIAIENARLLNELRESLDRQTATSDVLHVISSSPGNLKSVFDAILENATRICQANFGILNFYDEGGLRMGAMHNAPRDFADWHADWLRSQRGPYQPIPGSPPDRVIKTKKVCHVVDNASEASPGRAATLGGARSTVCVPILKEDVLIGTITIFRQEVRPFTDKQIALLASFANQAVIAIENARLLDDLNKLNQQLENRVADQVGEIERMGRLRRFLPPQVADLIVASGSEKQLESHRREITALFCDLRGFTGFSESSDPEDVMALLAEYHAAIGQIINKYSGTLERYAGDGVMVIFNDPVPVDNPALQAVLMALDMRAAIGALIERWRDLGHDLGFGIGIAHGFATLGTIGFEGRRDYAAIGTVSNVASRLCDEAKPGQILISPRVRQAVEKAVTLEPVGEFALKGIRRPMLAYNVLSSAVLPAAGK